VTIPKIQWYPGHIAKAEKKLKEMIKRVDLVIEVRDARIPLSTSHQHLDNWIKDKKHLLVINKSDMISKSAIKIWTQWFREKKQTPFWCDSKKGVGIKEICKAAAESRLSIDKRRKLRGMNSRAIRALTLGFPNVGKSALINRIANKRVVESARKAGVTRSLRWIRLNTGIDLLDAPGIIPPNLDDQKSALNLAICDDIGEAAYDLDSVAKEFIRIILQLQSNPISNISIPQISQRYGIDFNNKLKCPDQLIKFASEKHTSGDSRRMASRLLEDFRTQMLGKICLEVPSDY
tara:strand:+ start:1145 stop:2017 length:873 start_codon:yes stop_codon:yes gene_type:complete